MNDKTQELLEADKAFSELSKNIGASKAFEQYLIENAVQLPNRNNPIFGSKKIAETMAGDYKLTWIPQDGLVSSSEDLGYTWGVYELVFTNKEGNEETEKGKYLNVWVKDKSGSWKVLVDMGNLS